MEETNEANDRHVSVESGSLEEEIKDKKREEDDAETEADFSQNIEDDAIHFNATNVFLIGMIIVIVFFGIVGILGSFKGKKEKKTELDKSGSKFSLNIDSFFKEKESDHNSARTAEEKLPETDEEVEAVLESLPDWVKMKTPQEPRSH